MRVALVHDDLVQWGGAERILEGLCDLFPEAPIYTSIYDYTNPYLSKKFASKRIITSFMQKIPGWKELYKGLLPLYPIAFEQFDFSKYDLVLHHSTRFAKSVITKPETIHVCYCATPPRFLWNFSGQKLPSIIEPYLRFLRHFDKISAQRVDTWIAGSKNARERIKKIYHKESEVCYPFIDLNRFQGVDTFEGGYYLIVARLNKYKRVDLAVNYFNKTNLKLKIIGIGPELENLSRKASKNIEFLGAVSEEALLSLLSGCRALIILGEEDFGLTSLEAQALGKPVIAFGKGGALETVVEDKTGVFFYNQTSEDLGEAIKKLEKVKIRGQACKGNAENFSKEKFKIKIMELLKKYGL